MNMNEEEYLNYIVNVSDKVLNAIEDIFMKSEPQPTGCDMIDTMAFVSILVFARQIKLQYSSKKTMQSVMKSMMLSLKCQIDLLAKPFIDKEEQWDIVFDDANEEGGENDKV